MRTRAGPDTGRLAKLVGPARHLVVVAFVAALLSAVGCGGAAQHLTQMHIETATQPGQAAKPSAARILLAGASRLVLATTEDGVTVLAANGTGRLQWRRDVARGHTKPAAASATQLWLPQDIDAAGGPQALLGLDVASGVVRWRVPLRGRATGVFALPPYVAVQSEPTGQSEAEVLLIHATTGTVDARWRVPGARLIGAGGGSWLWLHRAAPGAGTLFGIDITRVRCAKPGCVPAPQWQRAFASVPQQTDTTLCGVPLPRLRSCVDGRTGKRLWLDYAALLPLMEAGPAGLIASGHDGWGVPFIAALTPRDLSLRWRRRYGATASRITQQATTITAWTAAGLNVARSADGRALTQLPVPPQQVRDVAATTTALTWLFGRGHSLSIGHDRIGVGPTQAPRQPTATPPWLRPGVVLHYVEVRFERRDPQTGGLIGAQPPRQVQVRIVTLAKEISLEISADGQQTRALTVPRDAPSELIALLPKQTAAPGLPATRKATKGSPIHLGLRALNAAQQGGHISLQASDPGAVFAGFSLHRIGYVGRGKNHPTPRDLRAIRLRSVAGSSAGAHHYLIAPWAKLPLVLRIDGPKRLLLLTAVVSNTP